MLEELDLVEENKRLKKEKLEKECIEKEIAIVVIISTPNDSSFGFFNLLLPLLSETKLEVLLVDVGILGGMSVVF